MVTLDPNGPLPPIVKPPAPVTLRVPPVQWKYPGKPDVSSAPTLTLAPGFTCTPPPPLFQIFNAPLADKTPPLLMATVACPPADVGVPPIKASPNTENDPPVPIVSDPTPPLL